MKNRSLRTQLGFVFLGFLLLVISSVAVTFWLVQTQQNDATIINLAGRQRMLAQQMTRLALTDPINPELTTTTARFEQTLDVLMNGGEVIDSNGRSLILSPTADPTIQAHLLEITNQWLAFQTHLQPPIDSVLLQSDFATLLSQLDNTVSAYEAEAQTKITRLRWVQVIFLTAAFLLLAWGYHLVHHQLIRPLAVLGTVAQEIGIGNLAATVPVLSGYELNQLGQTMERMRSEIAVYQNSLEQKVAQRTQELTTAFDFSQEIVRELEPAHLLQSVADHTRHLMQGTAVSVCVLDDNGRTLELVASSGEENQHIGLRQSATRGIALPVIQKHETIIAEGGCANCGFLHHFPDDSCAAAPLQVGGRTLGALCVVRPQNPFDADEARALSLLANAAAIALENTHLIEVGKQQAEENASLAERERLAANLHDNLAQTLGAMHLSVDQLGHELASGEVEQAKIRVVEIQTNVQRAYAQVRMALTGLRESTPDEDELLTAVRMLLIDFEAQSGLPVQLNVADKMSGVGLTAVTQKQLLHILREALTNVRRHAQAACIQVYITHDEGNICLDVVDDGIGFDPDQVNSQNHLGLSIMRMRAERSEGSLSIHSVPGEGARVTAVFPAIQTQEHEPEAI